jgi:hypothetical protein
MTKQEYNWYNTEREDSLGHKIRVGDLVVFHWWDRRVEVGMVTKMCPNVIKILPLRNQGSPSWWEVQRFPDRVVKIKSDAIPEN